MIYPNRFFKSRGTYSQTYIGLFNEFCMLTLPLTEFCKLCGVNEFGDQAAVTASLKKRDHAKKLECAKKIVQDFIDSDKYVFGKNYVYLSKEAIEKLRLRRAAYINAVRAEKTDVEVMTVVTKSYFILRPLLRNWILKFRVRRLFAAVLSNSEQLDTILDIIKNKDLNSDLHSEYDLGVRRSKEFNFETIFHAAMRSPSPSTVITKLGVGLGDLVKVDSKGNTLLHVLAEFNPTLDCAKVFTFNVVEYRIMFSYIVYCLIL